MQATERPSHRRPTFWAFALAILFSAWPNTAPCQEAAAPQLAPPEVDNAASELDGTVVADDPAAPETEPDGESVASDPVPGGDAKESKPRRLRMPSYFSQVVDAEQKSRVLAIEAEYAPRIEELQKQLEALKAERDAKARAVLSNDQRVRVDELISAALVKRKASAQARREKWQAFLKWLENEDKPNP